MRGSLNEMSQSRGVDRKTIRKYVAPAAAAGIAPGGPAKTEQEWADLVREWRSATTPSPAATPNAPPRSKSSNQSEVFSRRQQAMAQPRVTKAWWMSSRRSQRMGRQRNQCSSA
jgi:hypothetical protein